MHQSAAECSKCPSELQNASEHFRGLQSVPVSFTVLQSAPVISRVHQSPSECCKVSQWASECIRALQSAAVVFQSALEISKILKRGHILAEITLWRIGLLGNFCIILLKILLTRLTRLALPVSRDQSRQPKSRLAVSSRGHTNYIVHTRNANGDSI